jgi:hypothetical protein
MIDNRTGEIRYRKLVFDKSGNALFVWGRKNGMIENIYFTCFKKEGYWTEPELLESDAELKGFAMDGAGNAMLLLTKSESYKSALFSSYVNAGTLSWGSLEPVENHSAEMFTADISFTPGGNVFALWQEEGGEIYSSLYIPGSGWKESELVYEYAYPYGYPLFEIQPNGNVIAVWQTVDNHIMANHWK